MASRRPIPSPSTDPAPYYGADPNEPTLVYQVEGAPRRRRGRRILRTLLIVLLLLLVLLSISGAAVYEDPALLAPIGGALLGTQPGTVAWNGHDPVNILVMGVDQRTNEQTRSDSMIVMRVDPSSHDVEMLSVPRDLWVTIPSADPNRPYGQYKINAAYAIGWAIPQGSQGPQYAALTVEDALHIPVNYYAVVKFAGFQSVIDAIGGVNVCVPQAINDVQYPADVGYGYDPLHVKAGCQTMDGTLALKYTRERHQYAQQDLGRIQAQQAVLAGITKGLFSPGTLLRAPAILSAANGALTTNMPHSMLPQLGLLLARAKGTHLHHSYINQDGGYVTNAVSGDGQDILLPVNNDWTKIWGLTTGLFADPQLQAEHATIQVRDGQNTAGLAALYTTVLGKLGFNTTGFAPRNADKSTYTRSLLVVNQDLPGAGYTARLLAQMLQADVAYRHIGTDHAQIVAILGSQATEGS